VSEGPRTRVDAAKRLAQEETLSWLGRGKTVETRGGWSALVSGSGGGGNFNQHARLDPTL
jgi:hypothetical protein